MKGEDPRSRTLRHERERRRQELPARIGRILEQHRAQQLVRAEGVRSGVKRAGDRTLSGYASVFGNVDAHGDMIVPGAYDEWLAWYRAQSDPLLLLDHHATPEEIEQDPARVLGWAEDVRVDGHGLFTDFRLRPGEPGEEIVRKVRAGAWDGLSIGYTVRDYRAPTWEERERGALRVLLAVWVTETSLVRFPANTSARVTATKSAGEIIIGRIRAELARRRDASGLMEADAQAVLNARLRGLIGRSW